MEFDLVNDNNRAVLSVCVSVSLAIPNYEEWALIRQLCRRTYWASDSTVFEKLLPHQKHHLYRLHCSIRDYSRALDVSLMGHGKSYTSVALAVELGLPMIVFAPGSSQYNWECAFKHFSIKDVAFYPYSSFQRKNPPFFKPLAKPEDPDAPKVPNYESFKLCDSWAERCASGVLLVLDEVHFLKNKNLRHHLSVQMVREMFSCPGLPSKLLCLSGTPFDKPEHAPHLARVLGLYTVDPLAQMNPYTQELELRGLRQVLDFCQRLNPHFNPTIPTFNYGDDFSTTLLNKCLLEQIKPKLFFAMPPPWKREGAAAVPPVFTADLTYDGEIDDPSRHMINAAMNTIQIAHSMFARRHNIPQAMQMLTSGLKQLETGKIPCFLATAERLLEQQPNTKVIVMCSYLDPINALAARLAGYRPLVVQGSVPFGKRADIIREFQEPNCNRRLLIANMNLLANGVDLDDQHGDFPRQMIISPSYNLTTLRQVAQRVDRTHTKSGASVYYLYYKGWSESKLMASLKDKTGMLSQSTSNEEYNIEHHQLTFSQLF